MNINVLQTRYVNICSNSLFINLMDKELPRSKMLNGNDTYHPIYITIVYLTPPSPPKKKKMRERERKRERESAREVGGAEFGPGYAITRSSDARP